MRFPTGPEPGRCGHQTADPSLLNLRACLDLRGLMPKVGTMWDFKQTQSEQQVLDTSHAAYLQIFDAKWKKKRNLKYPGNFCLYHLWPLPARRCLPCSCLCPAAACHPSRQGFIILAWLSPLAALLPSRPCRAASTSLLAAWLLIAPAPFISSVFLICVFHVIFPFH